MARTPDIQIFTCPACAKLYKRKVDVWMNLQRPPPLASPSALVPRTCVCGRVFLLSESTVIANLPGDRGRGRDTLSECGMDQLDIPAFLRKRDDSENSPNTTPRRERARTEPGQGRKGWLFRFIRDLLNKLKPNPQRKGSKGKRDLVQSVLWDMEAIALPERIAPDGATPCTTDKNGGKNSAPTR